AVRLLVPITIPNAKAEAKKSNVLALPLDDIARQNNPTKIIATVSPTTPGE
ncbi:unnamed protein product, partial [marine sediment metagenome]